MHSWPDRGIPVAEPVPCDWFDRVPVGFLETDSGGRIARTNRTLRAWTGRRAEELEGLEWSEALLSPASRVLATTHILPILETEGRVNKLILDLLGEGGRRIHVVAHIERTSLPGAPETHRFTFVEAPERRSWEEQVLKATRAAEDALLEVRELNAHLERKVAERTEDLATANRDLDAYARSVAHDLRNPLQAILSLGEALQVSAGSGLAPADAERLRQLLQSASSMETLIGGLLTLAQASGSPLVRQTVDLTSMAERIVAELRAAHPERAVETRVEPGLSCAGDPSLLEVVLRNLLGNAWKYTAGTQGARVSFERDADGSFLVRDNGAGFDMAVAERLFQPFQRLHNAQAFPGIGLGLVATKRIIERHGGSLRVIAAPGLGATFQFSIGGSLCENDAGVQGV
jgi:signal transduction histidine kinase